MLPTQNSLGVAGGCTTAQLRIAHIDHGVNAGDLHIETTENSIGLIGATTYGVVVEVNQCAIVDDDILGTDINTDLVVARIGG